MNLNKKLSFKLIIITFLVISQSIFPAEKTLRWAADATSGAPYVFQDPNNPTKLIGFEVDLINAIAKHLNMTPVFVQNAWDGLIPALARDDYDIAINGLEITSDRELVVEFSRPYYITSEKLVIRSSSNSYFELNDLKNKAVGTLKNSVAERILKDIPEITVKNYEQESDSYSDLLNGRTEAVLLDDPIAMYYAGWNPQFKLVGNPIGELKYGIALKKGAIALRDSINKAIINIQTTGELREILESWNLWNFQTANYLGDHRISDPKPTNYQSFIKFHKKELTLNEQIMKRVNYLPLFGKAAITTIEITILSMIIAIVFGLFLALVRVYAPPPFSTFAVLYIEIVRGTPLLIQLYFIFYGLPNLGIKFEPLFAAVIGLGLNYAAYEAENYRAGLFAVPRGQMEAAISLGMTRQQALRHIIIPQAIRLVIPPITNDFISLLKDSSLVSVITMVELTKVYEQISSNNYDNAWAAIIVAIIYLLIGLPFVKLSKVAEKHFALERRRVVN